LFKENIQKGAISKYKMNFDEEKYWIRPCSTLFILDALGEITFLEDGEE